MEDNIPASFVHLNGADNNSSEKGVFLVTVAKAIAVLTVFNCDSMFMHVCVLVFMNSPLATTFGSDST
jgi:hypothetical protein